MRWRGRRRSVARSGSYAVAQTSVCGFPFDLGEDSPLNFYLVEIPRFSLKRQIEFFHSGLNCFLPIFEQTADRCVVQFGFLP